MKRKHFRYCKVLTVLPCHKRAELVSRLQAPLGFVSRRLDSFSESVKYSFDVLQKDMLSYHVWTESLFNKLLLISISSLVISLITLIVSLYV